MKRILGFFVVILAFSVVGCGSEKDKGINKDKDKPKAAEKEK
jgi:hypothetical protein